MANNSQKIIDIPGRIHSTAIEKQVAGANEIYDDSKNKFQEEINADVDTAIGSDNEPTSIRGRIKTLENAVGDGGSVDERISSAINALDATKSQAAGEDGLALSITETNGKITSISGSIAVNTYDAYGAASTVKTELSEDIDNIGVLIPSQATSSNQLADKEFVTSSVSTATATFRGTSEAGLSEAQFLSWAYELPKDINDYIFWNTEDSAGNVLYKRYKYNGTQWVYEYTLNNSSFTSAQWAAIESGITSGLVDKLTDLPTNASLTTSLSGKQDKVAKLGSTTKPVYTSAAGTFAECSTYAGGTAVTLNGSSKAASTASFYAPTGAGTSGNVLISKGSGAPSWRNLKSSDLYTNNATGDITNDGMEFLTSYQSAEGFANETYGDRVYRRPISALWAYIKGKADSAYLPLSGGTMANTNKVTNLNADLLDGYTAHNFYHKAFSEKEMSPSGTSLAGWYRVAQFTEVGGRGMSFLLSIYERYNNGAPNPATFIINVGSKVVTIRQLGAGVRTPTHISAIRVVGNSSSVTTYYLDLYYTYSSTTAANTQGFNLINLGSNNSQQYITLVDWTSQPASDSLPSGETLYASATISTTFNVDKAAQLLTARTLWGQSFDGSGNVDGNMTGVGTISASGNLTITKTSGATGVSITNTTGGANINYSITGKTYSMFFGIGSGNINRGIYDTTNNKWAIYFNADNTILNYGNVGIGTTEPAYKLDVEGNVGIKGTNNSIVITPSSTDTYTGIYYGPITDGYGWSFNTNKDKYYIWNSNLSREVFGISNAGTVQVNLPTISCSTAVGTAAKVATINGYTLTTGNIVKIKFTKGNTSTSATLNISSTGAKGIRLNDGSAIASDTIAANDVVTMVYDGTYYRIKGINTDITDGYAAYVNGALAVRTLHFHDSSNGRIFSINGGGSITLKAPTKANWAGGLNTYTHDGNTCLGGFGYYGSVDVLNYLYVGAAYDNPWVTFLPNGNVGIGTVEPAQKLEVTGNILAANSDTTETSIRTTNSNGSTSLMVSSNRGVYDNTNSKWLVAYHKTGEFTMLSDNNTLVGSYYSGTVNTAVGTTAKTCSITGYTLTAGNIVVVKFTNGNSVAQPTLNITSTGAKGIRQMHGANLASDTIPAGAYVTLMYNGSQYIIMGVNGLNYSLLTNTISARDIYVNGTIHWTKATSLTTPQFVLSMDAYADGGDTHYTSIADLKTTLELGAAAAKGVVTSIDTSASLPTSNAVKTFVEGKGYTTNTGTVTKVTAGTGLSIGTTAGGNFTTSGTINHTNSVTAQTTQAVYPIKIDACGHISAYGSAQTIGAACAKGVTDNSASTAVTSTDTNLITGRTLYYAGYTKVVASAYCSTAAATAAKTATCTGYTLTKYNRIQVILVNANTSESALTLNINGTGAKTIYINGTVSSATNCTLPAGSYEVYYSGTYYYFRTDGKIHGSITGGAASVNGHTVEADVPSDAVFTDTKNTAGSTNTTSKIFLVGATSQAANPQTYSNSSCYAQSGNLYATNFYTTSDRSKKKNIEQYSEHISKFTLKETGRDAYGVIAQDVPEMFRAGEEGSYTVNYNSVLSYYVGILENRVLKLEKEIEELKKK